METSVLDTDTALTANSDAKVATQKAVKAYVDAGGNVNASTTGKGIVEEATQAEVDAGTATGGTGAQLYVNPSTILRKALTLICRSVIPSNDATTVGTGVTGTTAIVGQIHIPLQITVNKVSLRFGAVSAAGTFDVSIYSEDGQTRHISVTTASVSANTIVTTAVSAVTLYPGIYYVMVNGNSTANAEVYCYNQAGTGFTTTTGLVDDVTSEPILQGTYTITADTPPETVTLASITATDDTTAIIRLDN